MRRTRGRGGNGHSNQGNYNSGPRRSSGAVPSRHQVFDSNGPDVRIRGNAFQVYDKYLTLARDAAASGDRVKAESLLQHAEHYYRIMLAIQEATGETYQLRGQNGEEQPGEGAATVEDPAQMPQPSVDGAVDMSQPQPEAAVA